MRRFRGDGVVSLTLIHSTCPNDTFVFHAWSHGLIPGAPAVAVRYADVDISNDLAKAGTGDVVKISFAALPWILDQYSLLPCGGAMGRGCGPLILTRENRELKHARVAIPGELTTAYLLFKLYSAGIPLGKVDVLPFSKIMPAVAAGEYDAGLVIHEARFTYAAHGLNCLADLGAWWELQSGLPIPLGAIVCRRTLDPKPIANAIRQSVEQAWAHPEISRAYVMKHAQEMEPSVVDAHIGLYVNASTRQMTEQDGAAVGELLKRAGFPDAAEKAQRDLRAAKN